MAETLPAGPSRPHKEGSPEVADDDDGCCLSLHKESGESATLATAGESDYGMFSASGGSCRFLHEEENEEELEQDGRGGRPADDGDADAVSSFSEESATDDWDGAPSDDVRLDRTLRRPSDNPIEGRRRLSARIPSSVHLPSCCEEEGDGAAYTEEDDERGDGGSVQSSITSQGAEEGQDAKHNTSEVAEPEPVDPQQAQALPLEPSPPQQPKASQPEPVFSYSPAVLPPSSSLPMPQVPLVKRTSSISIDTSIPLNFHRRGAVRVLPKPDPALLELAQLPTRTDQQHRRLLRSSSCSFRSLPCPARPSPSEEPPALKRRVSFTTVRVREHRITMGDNPSCTYGTPVSLAWESLQREDVTLEEYEAHRYGIKNGRKGRPRNLRELHLNHYRRRDLLQLEGYLLEEIKAQKRATDRVRKQRELTRLLAQTGVMSRIEDMVESAGRKVQRAMGKDPNRRNNKAAAGGTDKDLILRVMEADHSHTTVSTAASTDSLAAVR
jgi:hypothetical protein